MGDFKKLVVWQRARCLVAAVYAATDAFPAAERYGLTAQVRRATISISANIAESSGRLLPRDQARLLQIALGSARELESHCLIAGDLGFLVPDQVAFLSAGLDEVQRMLVSMIRIVSRRSPVSRRQSPVSRLTAPSLR